MALVLGLAVALLRGDRGRRTSLVLAALLLPVAAFFMVSGYIWAYGSNRCDETCDPREGWSGTMDAWQWDAMFWVALLGFLAFVVTTGLLVWRRPRHAGIALAVSVALFAASGVLQAEVTSGL